MYMGISTQLLRHAKTSDDDALPMLRCRCQIFGTDLHHLKCVLLRLSARDIVFMVW